MEEEATKRKAEGRQAAGHAVWVEQSPVEALLWLGAGYMLRVWGGR